MKRRSRTRQRLLVVASGFVVAASIQFGAQWLLFVLISRREGMASAGEYALALSLVAPFFLAVTGGLRLVQLTMTDRRERLATAYVSRGAGLLLAAVGACLVYGFGIGEHLAIGLVVAVATQRVVDAFAEVSLAEYQIAGVPEAAVISSALRGALLLLAFAVGSQAGLSTAWAIGVAAGASLGGHLVADHRQIAAILRISGRGHSIGVRSVLRRAIPFGLATALASGALAWPRLVVGLYGGPSEAARFASLTFLFAAASLVTTSLGQSAIPRMAYAVEAGHTVEYRRIGRGLMLSGLVLGAAAVAVSVAVGGPAIMWLYGPSYSGLEGPLAIMAVALAITCLGTFTQDSLTAMGASGAQLVAFGSSAAATVAASFLLVPEVGVAGAAIAVVVGASLQLGLLLRSRRVIEERVFGEARSQRRA